MKKDIDEIIAQFHDVEEKLNESRRKLFSECDKTLFRSKNFDSYEFCLERYFLKINDIFYNGKYNDEIENFLNSNDLHQRLDALKIIKDCNLGSDFMEKILPSLLDCSICGNNDDTIISRKILVRKYVKKEKIIDLLEAKIQYIIDNARKGTNNEYYIYQGVGHVMLLLGATDLLRKHIDFCENSDDPEIKDLAVDFKERL